MTLPSSGLDALIARAASMGLSAPDASTLTRALYSSDASLYRIPPLAVARPGSVQELTGLVDAARRSGVPLTARGAGTSCAGNAVGPGLIVDLRDLDAIVAIDPDARTATVEPGVVQAQLSRAASGVGLRFGPDPSTSSRCTVGGMIGNNACGPRALGYGRTSDNVIALDVITGTGERLTLSSGEAMRTHPSPTLRGLARLVDEHADLIRAEFGRFSRQVSGMSLECLLPERGFDVAKFLVGTEGTLAVVTSATVRLVADDPVKAMVVLGYPTMPEAADDITALLPFRPTAVEGLDSRIVDVVRRRHGDASVPRLPDGQAWTMIELTGTDAAQVDARAHALLAASHATDGWVVPDESSATRLWAIRSAGAGLAAISLDAPAHAGWEDAAVPPEHLGEYLRAFDELLARHHLHGLPYGHFGEGCVHCRIDFPLREPGGPAAYRAFVTEAAHLAARFGGSASGEHGDGRARSELLPAMYSPAALDLFAQVKALFDPANLLNPGVLVAPDPVDAALREASWAGSELGRTAPKFGADIHRCTGVGACVSREATTLMCPSYQATHEEKDSTRGRARVLQEMMNGSLITDGWRSREVADALDLCLSCKGCSHDCPTGTDVASAKSKVLDAAYRGRVRPRDHYALGFLPTWGRLVTAVPGLPRVANAVLGSAASGPLRRLAGLDDTPRTMPTFASRRTSRGVRARGTGRPVVIWVDSFNDAFASQQAQATAAALIAGGYAPRVLERTACCGLTWITTGQRDRAAAKIRASLDVLTLIVDEGIPIVGTEPSCMAVWRSDAAELVDDPRVARVASGVHTLAELLVDDPDFTMPDLTGHTIVAQPHCHQASVLGWDADAALLRRSGASVTTLHGCCGLAGNFGMQAGHRDVSVAIAQGSLIPAIEAAGPDAIVLADGFSCRTQIADLTPRRALTLAQLIASHQNDHS